MSLNSPEGRLLTLSSPLAGQIQQPVKQGPGLSGAAVTASVSSALLAMLLVALACVKCRVFA